MSNTDSMEVLAFKITSTMGSLEELRGRINDAIAAVSNIGVMDVQSKQNTVELEKLRVDLHRLNSQLITAQNELEILIRSGDSSVSLTVKELGVRFDTHREDVNRKLNIAHGVIATLTLVASAVIGLMGVQIKSMSEKIESSYAYVSALKTLTAEEQLRKLLSSPQKSDK